MRVNKNINNQKGITLISLVITVIVILILTGIAIRFAVGEDEGIITKTTEATKAQVIAQAKEEVGSAWEAVSTDYMKDKKSFSNSVMSDYLTDRERINNYLGDKGEVVSNPTYDSTTKTYNVIYKPSDEDVELTFTFSDSGNIINYETTAVQIEIWDGTSASESLLGSGTEEDPFLIKTAEDFRFLQNAIIAKNTTYTFASYRQVRDIYLNDVTNFNNWSTQNSGLNDCFAEGTFYGQYDGEGHKIIGLYINREDYASGLFQYVYCAEDENHNQITNAYVKNLKVKNAYVSGTYAVGIISGYISNNVIVENCEVDGVAKASNMMCGGITGNAYYSSKIIGCKNRATITGPHYIGGIVGQSNGDIEIRNCENSGLVFGTSNVGGISGQAISRSKIYNCINSGKLESFGDNYFYYIGGIVGYFEGEVKNCQNKGNIILHDLGKTTYQTGGIIGLACGGGSSSSLIENNTNSGNIDSNYANIGGIVGDGTSDEGYKNMIVIKNCTNTGKNASTQATLPLVGNGYYTISE